MLEPGAGEIRCDHDPRERAAANGIWGCPQFQAVVDQENKQGKKQAAQQNHRQEARAQRALRRNG
jgi:hypothetical protein